MTKDEARSMIKTNIDTVKIIVENNEYCKDLNLTEIDARLLTIEAPDNEYVIRINPKTYVLKVGDRKSNGMYTISPKETAEEAELEAMALDVASDYLMWAISGYDEQELNFINIGD